MNSQLPLTVLWQIREMLTIGDRLRMRRVCRWWNYALAGKKAEINVICAYVDCATPVFRTITDSGLRIYRFSTMDGEMQNEDHQLYKSTALMNFLSNVHSIGRFEFDEVSERTMASCSQLLCSIRESHLRINVSDMSFKFWYKPPSLATIVKMISVVDFSAIERFEIVLHAIRAVTETHLRNALNDAHLFFGCCAKMINITELHIPVHYLDSKLPLEACAMPKLRKLSLTVHFIEQQKLLIDTCLPWSLSGNR
ncbi:hypothetical protein Tcan_15302 [Toxocara canis]|uniref:F-box domain-containing protein n=1 Tax=Toxocara canis TaxID=6265 RepID=A0A0B2VYU1_TOXCA|nr:hypothetical protein Tcan_15302 [Toxocara canis]